MVLVALAIVSIVGMAALSIDVVTLYLANAEAQRSADAAALSAARMLSLTSITGDPLNSGAHWTQACTLATQVATAVAQQNTVGGASSVVTVTYPNNPDPVACTGTVAQFGVNPLVTVRVQRTNLPTFFARIWGRTSAAVSATATAEAFNPSNSGVVGNGGASGQVVPVQPRCVKPWLVPNLDPSNCNPLDSGNNCQPFIITSNGVINNPKIKLSTTDPGVIGERFNLFADCDATPGSCNLLNPTPVVDSVKPGAPAHPPQSLEYLPGEVPVTSTAVPACATTSYQAAIAGCDQSTVYQCGVPHAAATPPNRVALDVLNPGGSGGDTAVGAACLIHQNDGQDVLDSTVYPYQIKPGAGNPLGLASTNVITTSSSIVTVPIYDDANPIAPTGKSDVTIVGFLQVFINAVNGDGSLDVTILNVAGCGNGTPAVGSPVNGSSPVPVRLVQKFP